MQQLIKVLHPTTSLSILFYNDIVAEQLPLTLMDGNGKRKALSSLGGYKPFGKSDLLEGVLKALSVASSATNNATGKWQDLKMVHIDKKKFVAEQEAAKKPATTSAPAAEPAVAPAAAKTAVPNVVTAASSKEAPYKQGVLPFCNTNEG